MEQYISKFALVAEIKRRIILLENNSDGIISTLASGMFVNEYKDLLSFLDTLETKEVNFEKIWEEYFKYRGDVATVNVKHLARHFFEFGLKTRKGI